MKRLHERLTVLDALAYEVTDSDEETAGEALGAQWFSVQEAHISDVEHGHGLCVFVGLFFKF